ncbi:MAG: amidohydrolase [Steroidobacteraceae bacterium]
MNIKSTLILAGVTAITLTAACSREPDPAATADVIYSGGDIVTVNDAQPSAEALAIKDGRILAVGSLADVEKAHKGRTTVMIDLGGKTLLPGFVDGHSHLTGVGLQAVSANLLPPPDGPVSTIAELQQVMRNFISRSPKVKDFGLAIGVNYDDSQLAEQRSPTRQELDAISTEVPIVITHQSGHLAVYNSKALAKAGVTAVTADPSGGVIRREAYGRTPDGVLEEMAFFSTVGRLLPKFTPAQAMEIAEEGQRIYVANGFTTAQEGRASTGGTTVLFDADKQGKLDLDVVIYSDLIATSGTLVAGDAIDPFAESDAAPATGTPPTPKFNISQAYTGHFRVGGVKLTFDGSPQGKTAWFTQPYFQPPQGQKADYAGYPAFPKPGEAQDWVDMAYQNDWQLLVHANGDAAIDELIETIGSAQKKYGGDDRRTVLIHGQYLRADQIPELKALGIIPSLYPMHTFYWGDWHRESVAGPERAEFISPTGAVLGAGMKFSIHSDAPVTYPNSMRVLDSAVNRTTRSGHVLGPDQRLSPADALKAMTLWPAYQHFEEQTKGSLEVGKRADLVILSANPLTVAPETLKDIQVVETIKDGKSIYKMPF